MTLTVIPWCCPIVLCLPIAASAVDCPGFSCDDLCATAPPMSAIVCGCVDEVESTPGTYGMGAIQGTVGERFAVPIVVHTSTAIESFGIELTFPAGLVRYDSTSFGTTNCPTCPSPTLIEDFSNVLAQLLPSGTAVRLAGLDVEGDDAIPPGQFGYLAWVHFTVLATGCDEFCISDGVDDLAGYSHCMPPSPIEPATWGRTKALYR